MHISHHYIKPILFIGVGALLVLIAIFMIGKSHILSSSSVEIIDSTTQSKQNEIQKTSETQIVVEVAGEVEKPGVYSLPQGSRVQDALLLSGKILSTADSESIEKTINKAAKLTDGQKIYIPKKGEHTQSVLSISSTTKLININSGSQTELESLPGVGAATAVKIIAGRPYQNVNELTSKKIIGVNLYEKIKDLISLY